MDRFHAIFQSACSYTLSGKRLHELFVVCARRWMMGLKLNRLYFALKRPNPLHRPVELHCLGRESLAGTGLKINIASGESHVMRAPLELVKRKPEPT